MGSTIAMAGSPLPLPGTAKPKQHRGIWRACLTLQTQIDLPSHARRKDVVTADLHAFPRPLG